MTTFVAITGTYILTWYKHMADDLYLFHIPLIHKRLHNLQDMELVIYLM
jgi:hypothetical protein